MKVISYFLTSLLFCAVSSGQSMGDDGAYPPPQPEPKSAQMPVVRTSSIGAIFTKDTRFPSLGPAFLSPSQLLWGERIIMDPDLSLSPEEAAKRCQNIKSRLPTAEEYGQLAEQLGGLMDRDYSPYSPDDDKEVIPDLVGYYYWTSSRDEKSGLSYAFSGDRGVLFLSNSETPGQYRMSVRCVRDLIVNSPHHGPDKNQGTSAPDRNR